MDVYIFYVHRDDGITKYQELIQSKNGKSSYCTVLVQSHTRTHLILASFYLQSQRQLSENQTYET